ncbi:MAG: hypothetical protein ACI8W7_003084 [Gammaproteobacteria bacterium]|jgi:hypothetical protein
MAAGDPGLGLPNSINAWSLTQRPSFTGGITRKWCPVIDASNGECR